MKYPIHNTEFIRVYPRVLLTWREQGKNYFLGLQQGTSLPPLKGVPIITYFQIHSILTNKPNFRNSKMNITLEMTSIYMISSAGSAQKTNPIQTQFNPKQTQFKPNKAKNKPNSKPICLTTNWFHQTNIIVTIP